MEVKSKLLKRRTHGDGKVSSSCDDFLLIDGRGPAQPIVGTVYFSNTKDGRGNRGVRAQLHDEVQRQAVVRPTKEREEDMIFAGGKIGCVHALQVVSAIDKQRDIGRGGQEDLAYEVGVVERQCRT